MAQKLEPQKEHATSESFIIRGCTVILLAFSSRSTKNLLLVNISSVNVFLLNARHLASYTVQVFFFSVVNTYFNYLYT